MCSQPRPQLVRSKSQGNGGALSQWKDKAKSMKDAVKETGSSVGQSLKNVASHADASFNTPGPKVKVKKGNVKKAKNMFNDLEKDKTHKPNVGGGSAGGGIGGGPGAGGGSAINRTREMFEGAGGHNGDHHVESAGSLSGSNRKTIFNKKPNEPAGAPASGGGSGLQRPHLKDSAPSSAAAEREREEKKREKMRKKKEKEDKEREREREREREKERGGGGGGAVAAVGVITSLLPSLPGKSTGDKWEKKHKDGDKKQNKEPKKNKPLKIHADESVGDKLSIFESKQLEEKRLDEEREAEVNRKRQEAADRRKQKELEAEQERLAEEKRKQKEEKERLDEEKRKQKEEEKEKERIEKEKERLEKEKRKEEEKEKDRIEKEKERVEKEKERQEREKEKEKERIEKEKERQEREREKEKERQEKEKEKLEKEKRKEEERQERERRKEEERERVRLEKEKIREEAALNQKLNKNSLFGTPLDELMLMQKQKYPSLQVPYILTYLADGILATHGPKEEGIFRMSGNSIEIDALRQKIEKTDCGIEIAPPENPHNVSTLFKQWIRTLPEPVIPVAYFDRCLQNADNPQECIKIVESLPDIHRKVLEYVITFLQTHILPPEVQEVTKMGTDNVALIFGASLLSNPDQKNEDILANSEVQIRFIKNLLVHMNGRPGARHKATGEIVSSRTRRATSSPTPVKASDGSPGAPRKLVINTSPLTQSGPGSNSPRLVTASPSGRSMTAPSQSTSSPSTPSNNSPPITPGPARPVPQPNRPPTPLTSSDKTRPLPKTASGEAGSGINHAPQQAPSGRGGSDIISRPNGGVPTQDSDVPVPPRSQKPSPGSPGPPRRPQPAPPKPQPSPGSERAAPVRKLPPPAGGATPPQSPQTPGQPQRQLPSAPGPKSEVAAPARAVPTPPAAGGGSGVGGRPLPSSPGGAAKPALVNRALPAKPPPNNKTATWN